MTTYATSASMCCMWSICGYVGSKSPRRRLDRGAVDRIGRVAASGTGPAHRPGATPPRPKWPKRAMPRSSACKPCTIWCSAGRNADRHPRSGRHRLCAVLPTRWVHAAAVAALSAIAARLGATPMQVALAWLLRRSPEHPADSRHFLPRASTGKPFRGRTRAAGRGTRDAR